MKRALDSEKLPEAKKPKIEVYDGLHKSIQFLNGGGFLSNIYREVFPFFPVLDFFQKLVNKTFYDKEWTLGRVKSYFENFVLKNPEYSSSLDNPQLQDFFAGKVEAEEMIPFFKDLDAQIHAENPRDLKTFYQIVNSRKYVNSIATVYEGMGCLWKNNLLKVKPVNPIDDKEFFEIFLISMLFSFDKKGTVRPLFPSLKAFLKENEGNPLLGEFKVLMRGKNHQLMVIFLFAYLSSFSKDYLGFPNGSRLIFPQVEDEILTQYGQLFEEKAFDKVDNWKIVVNSLMTLLCSLLTKI